MHDNGGAKNKEHIDDHISQSKIKKNLKKTTIKKVSQLNVHVIR
jgi:hypothetical protein